MLSPISAVASPVASRMSRSEALTASLSASRIVPASKSISGLMTKLAVGSRSALTIARVTPRSARLSAGMLVATTMSQPRMRLAPPGAMRTVGEIVRRRRDADVAHDRAVLLRQAREVERRARHALDMGGHAEQRADGDDAGAADPGDEDVVGAIERRRGRQRQIGEQRRRIGRGAIGLPQLAAMHGDKTRAKALDAGKVLVAVRLVDPPLAAEFGLQRLHRDAVGDSRAVAAALADALVDEDALRRIRIEPALAAAALFRRAGLVVDQDREALDLAQLLLHGVEFAAVMNGRA